MALNKILNWKHIQGRNEGEKGGTIPRAPIRYGGAESLLGRRITAGGAEKSQQCHKYFLQYSKFAFERTPVRPWGRQTLFLPRAPSNLVTPLSTSYDLLSRKSNESLRLGWASLELLERNVNRTKTCLVRFNSCYQLTLLSNSISAEFSFYYCV